MQLESGNIRQDWQSYRPSWPGQLCIKSFSADELMNQDIEIRSFLTSLLVSSIPLQTTCVTQSPCPHGLEIRLRRIAMWCLAWPITT